MTEQHLTQEAREEMFREFIGQQLRAQTKALQDVRTYVGWLLGIVVVLIALQVLIAVAANA